jgi:hypothetical protein
VAKGSILFVLLSLVGYANVLHSAESFSDAPEHTRDSNAVSKAAESYEHALQVWKTPEDINAWIAANFTYDNTRSMRLSETQRAEKERFAIYKPLEFFAYKTGVCVDLSRFAVETLREINAHYDPKYLMIEFDPIQINGNTLRRHWLASFKRDGKTYFFADSKRPWYIAGPYNDTQAFINEYEQYRGRKIIAFRELASYQKQRRTQTLRMQASEKPN